jgi:hypothetical protein
MSCQRGTRPRHPPTERRTQAVAKHADVARHGRRACFHGQCFAEAPDRATGTGRNDACRERTVPNEMGVARQLRPKDAISSVHSRRFNPLPSGATDSPASIRRTTASIGAENVTAPSR